MLPDIVLFIFPFLWLAFGLAFKNRLFGGLSGVTFILAGLYFVVSVLWIGLPMIGAGLAVMFSLWD
jgi:hypothetical protein